MPAHKRQICFFESHYRQYEPTLWPTSYSTSTAGASDAKPRWTCVLPPLSCSLNALWIEPLRGGVHRGRSIALASLLHPVFNSFIISFRRLLDLSHMLFSSVHLHFPHLTFFPSTNTQMRWELDIISSWFRHWLQRNLLGGINRNVTTQPLKHSASAEINTAELCGLKHWIVKVD